MNYKQELKTARKNNDWARVQELWKLLCVEAEIEEEASGSPGGAAELAKKRNDQGGERTAYGKKV